MKKRLEEEDPHRRPTHTATAPPPSFYLKISFSCTLATTNTNWLLDDVIGAPLSTFYPLSNRPMVPDLSIANHVLLQCFYHTRRFSDNLKPNKLCRRQGFLQGRRLGDVGALRQRWYIIVNVSFLVKCRGRKWQRLVTSGGKRKTDLVGLSIFDTA